MSQRSDHLGAGCAAGLGAALAMWSIGFLAHHPAIALNAPVTAAATVGAMFAVIAWRLRALGAGWRTGAIAGAVSACANLFALGAYLGETGDERVARPDAWLVALGFFGVSIAIGAAAGLLATRAPKPSKLADWLPELTLVAALSIAPLLLIGGLVTSSESGMAVPDWPTTYSGNMFLYPIGLMADERIFLEHTHRLFGMFAGFCVFVSAIAWCARAGNTRGKIAASLLLLSLIGGYIDSVAAEMANLDEHTKLLHYGIGAAVLPGVILAFASGARPATAVLLLLAIAAQGVLGGIRVTNNDLVLATVHGVTAQLLFTGAVMFAGAVRSAPQAAVAPESRTPVRFATVTLVVLTVQLVFGAMYRHLDSAHALWAHVGWSFFAATAAVGLGMACLHGPRDAPGARALRRIGMGLIHAVTLQFLLGWAALGVVMTAPDRGDIPTAEQLETTDPVPVLETLTATLHQANGALVLALAGLALVWAVRAGRARKLGGNA